ncbi:MAG: 3-octaprenyl-4-hydroxybenzoate carboxy-lyase, partial [Planctomycetota bacterium]
LNEGSKLVIAAAGPAIRTLPVGIDTRVQMPAALGFYNPRAFLPGILLVEGPPWKAAGDGADRSSDRAVEQFCAAYRRQDPINAFPLIVVVDDARFAAENLENFLWTTFTRSNPAADVYGIDAFVENKHWGCRGSLVIDARSKAHHAPALEEDREVSKRVDALAAPGGPLHGIF